MLATTTPTTRPEAKTEVGDVAVFDLADTEAKRVTKELSPEDQEILDNLERLYQKDPYSNDPLQVKKNLALILTHPQKKQFSEALKFWVEQGVDPDFKTFQFDFNLLTENPREALNIAKITWFFFENSPSETAYILFMNHVKNVEFIRLLIARINFYNQFTFTLSKPSYRFWRDTHSKMIEMSVKDAKQQHQEQTCFLIGLFRPNSPIKKVAKITEEKSDCTVQHDSALAGFSQQSAFDRKLVSLIFNFAAPKFSVTTKSIGDDPFENPYDDSLQTKWKRTLGRSKSF